MVWPLSGKHFGEALVTQVPTKSNTLSPPVATLSTCRGSSGRARGRTATCGSGAVGEHGNVAEGRDSLERHKASYGHARTARDATLAYDAIGTGSYGRRSMCEGRSATTTHPQHPRDGIPQPSHRTPIYPTTALVYPPRAVHSSLQGEPANRLGSALGTWMPASTASSKRVLGRL